MGGLIPTDGGVSDFADPPIGGYKNRLFRPTLPLLRSDLSVADDEPNRTQILLTKVRRDARIRNKFTRNIYIERSL